MGCDIHAIVFAASHYGKHPTEVMTFYEPRNYSLFTALAGVRREGREDIAPVAEPRGLPPYCLVEGNDFRAYWGRTYMGNHSFSWVTTDEFAEALRRIPATHRDPEYLACLAFMRALEDHSERVLPTSPGDERYPRRAFLVFGFDN